MSGIDLKLTVTHDEMKSFMQALKDMQAKEVLAGFPEEDDKPRQDAEGNPEPITNAAIAYVQNTGMPEQNLPARPFMVEGIENKREPITDAMGKSSSPYSTGTGWRSIRGYTPWAR
jgi:hypothetical protein